MKLPFDLGVKLFFRLLLPGFLLTLGLFPILFALLDSFGLAQQRDVAFVLTTILLGWLLLAGDMPIYMLLEGRRYWPLFLWKGLLNCEKNRLVKLNARIDAYYQKLEKKVSGEIDEIDETIWRRYIEASVEKRFFPLDENGERCAKYPTHLGNTLTSFETYAKTRYGLEDIFYWPRIWVNLSKDLREELDNQQAMADSTVYSTFALASAALLWAFYGLFKVLIGPVAAFLYYHKILYEPLGKGILAHIPEPFVCFLVGGASLLFSYFVVYRLAIFTNEQYGNYFMAIIDTNVSKIEKYVDVKGIANKITALTNIHIDDKEKFEAVRRYLQYYNAKLPDHIRPVPTPQIKSILQATKKGSEENIAGDIDQVNT
jgi:hypothetical protein